MRLLLLLLSCIPGCVHAQKINGIAKDESGSPLAGATITLMRDSSIVKLALSKADGSYSFSGIKEGSYRVAASYVGYKASSSAKLQLHANEMTTSDLLLVKLPASMKNITLNARRPLVELRADKMILNVEGTINATGSNALELLRRSPGVMLDKDDNISLAGKNGVQVYVDGRQTPLAGDDLAHYLKSIQSTQVDAIELITNPSAKYDAAGNAGIINIRLVKNKAFGMNGSVNAGWNIATYPKYNGGFALNYRNKKINFFSTYSYGYTPAETNFHIKKTLMDSLFWQEGTMFDLRRSQNLKAGVDYFLNTKNTIGIMVNGVFTKGTSTTNNHTDISEANAKVPDRILRADNHDDLARTTKNVNLNYTYADSKGKSFMVNADRGTYDFSSEQLQHNNYYTTAGVLIPGPVVYHIISPSVITINSIKGDYEENLFKGKLSAGAKSAWIKTDNDFRRYNVNPSSEDLDRDKSFRFIYQENINAGYLNYSRQCKMITMQLGVRVENTTMQGTSDGSKYNGSSYLANTTSFNRSYTDLFPSGSLSFNKNPKKVWSLSYSRRIDRPAYQDLNPFEFKLDEYTFMKGNINLRPQYTNSFSINHTYMYRFNFTLNYSHVNDLFTQVMDTIEKTKTFMTKKNLANQDITSLAISVPLQFKAYSLFTSVSTNYSKYKADFGEGRKINLDALGFTLFMQNSYRFAKTWTAELNGFYNAPTLYKGTFKVKSVYNVDAGLSKQVMQGKATMKAVVSDVFHTMQFRGRSDFAGQVLDFGYRNESSQLKLSFSYRFGNNGVKLLKQRTSGADEENKRVQAGGGMIGN
jgi:iron complex outermembrane recepter protein